jgi:hypothetical protein
VRNSLSFTQELLSLGQGNPFGVLVAGGVAL